MFDLIRDEYAKLGMKNPVLEAASAVAFGGVIIDASTWEQVTIAAASMGLKHAVKVTQRGRVLQFTVDTPKGVGKALNST